MKLKLNFKDEEDNFLALKRTKISADVTKICEFIHYSCESLQLFLFLSHTCIFRVYFTLLRCDLIYKSFWWISKKICDFISSFKLFLWKFEKKIFLSEFIDWVLFCDGDFFNIKVIYWNLIWSWWGIFRFVKN